LKKKSPSKTIDISGHFLVPPIRIVEADEAARVLKKYSISPNQLPHMLLSDPEAKLLGAKVGDVVAIERRDATATYTAYRIVVEK